MFETKRLGPETKPGDEVRYIPSERDDQIAGWGTNKNPRAYLDPDKTYTVEYVEVHSWHTKLWLVNEDGPFNSVHFEPAYENEN